MNEIATRAEGGALATMSESDMLKVLRSSLYPGAADESIRMVLGYCKASGLDPMQKPVHIVPMWDRNAGGMRDVIMPGVNLYRTQASRSGQMAGISEPEFGTMLTDKIGGQEITYPEWCRVTVSRALPDGHVGKFTAIEYWLENYAAKGGKDKSIAPNGMWTRRPRGQIAKCAEAQALRKAFPEIASAHTAEEMEGKTIHVDEPAHDGGADAAGWIDKVRATKTDDEAAAVWAEGGAEIAKAKDRTAYTAFRDAVLVHRKALKAALDANTVDMEDGTEAGDEFVRDMNAAERGRK